MNNLQGLIQSVKSLMGAALPLMVGIALLVFLWGLVRFLAKGGDSKAVEDGRRLMIWGVVALFVMVSVWGLVGFIQRNLGIFNNRL